MQSQADVYLSLVIAAGLLVVCGLQLCLGPDRLRSWREWCSDQDDD